MSTGTTAYTADQIVQRYTTASAEFKQAWEDRFYRAADEAGLLDGNGDLDPNKVLDRSYSEVRTKLVTHIEPGNDDRYSPHTSSTKEELAAAVFTAGPTPADAETNAIEKKAYEKCLSTVWNLTVQSGRGRIQKRLDADRLLLVRGKVYRNGNTIKDGVYVTLHPELVVREFLGPRFDALRKLTEALDDDFELAVQRDPSLEAPMRAAIEASVLEAATRLAVAAIGSGESNGKKALGK